ncbi:hypothetical protein WJX79_002155 [Trebouxia sp. C0005]
MAVDLPLKNSTAPAFLTEAPMSSGNNMHTCICVQADAKHQKLSLNRRPSGLTKADTVNRQLEQIKTTRQFQQVRLKTVELTASFSQELRSNANSQEDRKHATPMYLDVVAIAKRTKDAL